MKNIFIKVLIFLCFYLPTTYGTDFTISSFEYAQKEIEKIYLSPFVHKMGIGTLPFEKYLRYLEQDALYLEKYALAFEILASQTKESDEQAYFYSLAKASREEALHLHYTVLPKRPSVAENDVNKNYTDHLIFYVKKDPFLGMVALLPCAWVYYEVGQYLTPFLALYPQGNHPYEKWIKLYSADESKKELLKMKAIVNKMAERADEKTRQEALDIFKQSVKFEHDFFNAPF